MLQYLPYFWNKYKNPHSKYCNILLGHFIKDKTFISEEFVIILITTLCLTLFVTDLWTSAGPFRDNSMKDRKRKIAERNGSVSIKWSEKKILSIALCPNLMDSEDITIQLVRLLHIYDVYLGSIIAKKNNNNSISRHKILHKYTTTRTHNE